MNCFIQLTAVLLITTTLASRVRCEPWQVVNSRAYKAVDEDSSANDFLSPNPPPPDQTASMARFIVHYSSWGSLSHVSLQSQISGSPIARVYSISDGPIRASSGIPYFYLTPNDPELQDMFKDPRASLTLTLAQTPYCRFKAYDPEDPRCAQVILTGKLVFIKNTTAEWNHAQGALFSRHPVMKNWPDSHHWICCKLNIKRILVADNFGGNKYPSVSDYFRVQPEICSQHNPLLDMAFY